MEDEFSREFLTFHLFLREMSLEQHLKVDFSQPESTVSG
jgi:hypothetical protein